MQGRAAAYTARPQSVDKAPNRQNEVLNGLRLFAIFSFG